MEKEIESELEIVDLNITMTERSGRVHEIELDRDMKRAILSMLMNSFKDGLTIKDFKP